MPRIAKEDTILRFPDNGKDTTLFVNKGTRLTIDMIGLRTILYYQLIYYFLHVSPQITTPTSTQIQWNSNLLDGKTQRIETHSWRFPSDLDRV
jgi:hypothetical protein